MREICHQSDQENVMHEWSCSRSPLSRLALLSASAAFAIFSCAPAIAQSLPADPKGAPVLSGTYVITYMQNCVQDSGTLSQFTGDMTFDSSHGTFRLDEYDATGNPLALTHDNSKGTFSNTETVFVINGVAYKVKYGKIEKGIATYLSFIGVVPGENTTCALQGWLLHD